MVRKTARRHIASFMSLVMATLLLCQGMALAAYAGSRLPTLPTAAAMSACHDGGTTMQDSTPAAMQDHQPCHSDCQHLDSRPGNSDLDSNLGHVAVAGNFRFTVLLAVDGIQTPALPAPPADLPPLLRLRQLRI
jgi:hypothetical protein